MNKLAIHGGTPIFDTPGPHYSWPRITDETRRAVLKQLDTTISIKDRSGIIEIFEERFLQYYSAKYALLHNSGTMAIFAMFESIELSPGDEIICPNYTFFATISPITYTGAVPIFCDCDDNGNIDPDKLEQLITPKTRAVIVTHMWGIPCEMDEILRIVNKYNLILFEDCAHAHGASYRGRKMGTFGSASAWSFQESKIVSGGEGGLLLTNDIDIYSRAQLIGHYNRRCKQNIPLTHDKREFWETGFGLKLRSHPLAVAIANQQFDNLDNWIKQKNVFVNHIIKSISDIPFLRLPDIKECVSSWYILPIRFSPDLANNVSRDIFYRALVAEGLVDLDIPTLTGPICGLSLFQKLHTALPKRYRENIEAQSPTDFPMSNLFADQIIMMPVWAFKDDKETVDKYITGIRKVSNAIKSGQLRVENYN